MEWGAGGGGGEQRVVYDVVLNFLKLCTGIDIRLVLLPDLFTHILQGTLTVTKASVPARHSSYIITYPCPNPNAF